MEKVRLTYAGIGSRQTPLPVLRRMKELAGELAADGWRLRSGGAEGADSAFAAGAPEDAREIWRPAGDRTPSAEGRQMEPEVAARATRLASEAHPRWDRCSPYARKLHARNAAIVLGGKLDDRVDAVVCWTPHGAVAGGTGLAMRLARDRGAPVLNMASMSDTELRGALAGIAARKRAEPTPAARNEPETAPRPAASPSPAPERPGRPRSLPRASALPGRDRAAAGPSR